MLDIFVGFFSFHQQLFLFVFTLSKRFLQYILLTSLREQQSVFSCSITKSLYSALKKTDFSVNILKFL
uniref:Uncharacterized protein n=1 Tax=Arundo donax TaxID=35708 RepID=A0A0A9GQS2_ARUDO